MADFKVRIESDLFFIMKRRIDELTQENERLRRENADLQMSYELAQRNVTKLLGDND